MQKAKTTNIFFFKLIFMVKATSRIIPVSGTVQFEVDKKKFLNNIDLIVNIEIVKILI